MAKTTKTPSSRPSYKKSLRGLTKLLHDRLKYLQKNGTSVYVKEQEVLERIFAYILDKYPEAVMDWKSAQSLKRLYESGK